jgi:hypothetical protein
MGEVIGHYIVKSAPYISRSQYSAEQTLLPTAITGAYSRISKSYWCPYTSTLQNGPHRK